MRPTLVATAALALVLVSGSAWAGGKVLTTAEMDQVTAGITITSTSRASSSCSGGSCTTSVFTSGVGATATACGNGVCQSSSSN
jgi:outer membrane lipoprotein-sorting protein